MTQDAVVTKVFPNNGMAEVAVSRGTACGSNCGNCESCIFQNELKTIAKNSIHARPGEKVVIETVSSKIFKAAFIVYIIPIIAFCIGYALAYAFGAGESACMLISIAAFFVSVAVIVVTQRMSREKISFEITQFR